MWRTTKDISMEIEATWADVVENLDEIAGLARFAGPGGWNDADMLEACTPPPAFIPTSRLDRWVNFLMLASLPCAVHLHAVRCHNAPAGTETSSIMCGLTGCVSRRLEAQEGRSSRTQSSARTLPSGPLSSPPSSLAPTSGASQTITMPVSIPLWEPLSAVSLIKSKSWMSLTFTLHADRSVLMIACSGSWKKEELVLLKSREVIAINQDPLGVAGDRVWKQGAL